MFDRNEEDKELCAKAEAFASKSAGGADLAQWMRDCVTRAWLAGHADGKADTLRRAKAIVQCEDAIAAAQNVVAKTRGKAGK